MIKLIQFPLVWAPDHKSVASGAAPWPHADRRLYILQRLVYPVEYSCSNLSCFTKEKYELIRESFVYLISVSVGISPSDLLCYLFILSLYHSLKDPAVSFFLHIIIAVCAGAHRFLLSFFTQQLGKMSSGKSEMMSKITAIHSQREEALT